MWRTECFVILDRFLPVCSPNNPKNQNFEKMKQKSGDIITLHMCIINDNHMMNGSWDMKRDRQNFWSFWTFFAILPPWPNYEKLKKNTWRYHFTHVYHKWQLYDVWFLRYWAWRMCLLFFILGYILPYYPSNSPKNEN